MLRAACLRQRLAAEAARRVVLQVGSVPIDVGRQPAAALEIVGLALRFGLSTYDAAYVAMVLRLQLSVAKGDGRLRAAALGGGADWTR